MIAPLMSHIESAAHYFDGGFPDSLSIDMRHFISIAITVTSHNCILSQTTDISTIFPTSNKTSKLHIPGPLWGESISRRWIVLTKGNLEIFLKSWHRMRQPWIYRSLVLSHRFEVTFRFHSFLLRNYRIAFLYRVSLFNCFRGKINMYLKSLLSLHTVMTHVVEIFSHIRQAPNYST